MVSHIAILKYNIYLGAFWYVCETFYLTVLYSHHKCKAIKWHIKGNCRMVGLVRVTVRRQLPGSGYEELAFDFMPSGSKAGPNLSQWPFEVTQQCGEELRNEKFSAKRRFELFKGKCILHSVRNFMRYQVKIA